MDDSLDLEQMDRHSTVDLSLSVARNFDQTKAVEFVPVKRLAIDDEVLIIEEAVGQHQRVLRHLLRNAPE